MSKHVNMKGLLAASASIAALGSIKFEGQSIDQIVANLNTTFHEFKATQEEKINEIKSGFDDYVTTEKLETLNASVGELQKAIDDANAKLEAVQLSGGSDDTPVDPEYTANFKEFMMQGIEANVTKSPDSDGGFLAPTEWDRTITDKLIEISPMRQIASVQRITGGAFKKLYNLRGTASGWVSETAGRPETGTATFGDLNFALGEIYANPSASQNMLDDAEVDLQAWLAGEVQTEFDLEEGLAFIAGDGSNKPHGFLTYVTGQANAARHPFGAIEKTDAAAAAEVTSDELLDLIYSLPSRWAQAARFTMNRTTTGSIRKLKDGNDNYIWQPSVAAGQPATLHGQPITELPGMPDIAASAIPIAYGDFNAGYLIIDSAGVSVLRDPYSAKPFVQFYTTKRVGGGVNNPQAMKALQMAAS